MATSSTKYALCIWVHDTPIVGSVVSMSSVVAPRKEFSQYEIGDVVSAKCGSHGVFQAVIGMIGGEHDKKKMLEVLKGSAFTQLVGSLAIIQELREAKDTEDKQVVDNSVEAVDEVSNPVTKSKSGVKRKLSLPSESRNSEKNLQSAAEEKAFSDLQTVVEELSKTKKAKDTESKGLDSSQIVSRSLADVDKRDITRTPNTTIEDIPTSSGIISESLALVAETGLTPKSKVLTNKDTPKSKTPNYSNTDVERLISENGQLFSRVYQLENTTSTLWHEIEKLKSQLMQQQSQRSDQLVSANQFASPNQYASPNQFTGSFFQTQLDSVFSPSVPTTVKPSIAAAQDSQAAITTENNSSNTEERTYNGYVKSQVLSSICLCTDARKASTRLFRMLFTEEERVGRSLTGKASNTGIQRPAIEDVGKLKLLEDTVLDKFPGTPIESIRVVLRDMLKPSRTIKKKTT